jgi:hypothetical protein
MRISSSGQAPGRSGLYRLAATQTEVPPTEMQAAVPAPDFTNTYPPLWEGLGTHTYKITTGDPQAQAYFDQGLRLAYGFNHDEARRAFREAQHRDPDCAMCFWGEALVRRSREVRPPMSRRCGTTRAASPKPGAAISHRPRPKRAQSDRSCKALDSCR